MKKVNLPLLFVVALLGAFSAKAQLVTDDVFLQGRWLEACVAPNGSWGNTVNPPGTYHTTSGGSTYSYVDPITGTTASSTTTMDFQYDSHHDGWGVAAAGSVNYYGPYFLPGTPFDGWSIQVNGKMGQAFYTTGGYATLGGATFGGKNTGFTNSINTGGCITPNTKVGTWTGYFIPSGTDTLKIVAQNRVDTFSSWDVVTVKFTNASATTMNGLYYFATADPDNDELNTGGSFPTNNHIQYQNDSRHRVMVEARPPSIHQDAYSSLCTRDCRAKAMIYVSWPPPLVASDDLDLVYAGTGTTTIGSMSTCYYNLGQWTLNQDIAYGLVYKLGNLAPGDSTIISFAWNFKDSTCTDSAFPDPVLVLDGVQVPNHDTFNVCSHPGVTSLPVCLGYAADKDWSWASWTWSPSTGLATTTGITNTVNLTSLTGPITYTVTGNDSVTGMHSCNTYVLYFTVIPCFGANANTPCIGDLLYLSAIGDSVGATYQWYNPSGAAAGTTQHISVVPSVWADTGSWMVIRNLGGALDTALVHVTINPLPTFTLTCNGDSLCWSTTTVDTMKLYCMPVAPTYTYAWTGPLGYTSTAEFPIRSPYTYIDTGRYYITVTDNNGCRDTGSVVARIIPPLPPPVIHGQHHYCTGDGFVPFTTTPVPGASPMWYADSVGGTGSLVAPVVDLSYAHTVTVWASLVEGICEGLRSSYTVIVDSTPVPSVLTSNSPLCADSTLYLTASNGLTGGNYHWTGPAGFNSYLQNPTVVNAQTGNSGTYVVVYTLPTTCHSNANINVVVNPTPQAPVVTSNAPCDGFALNMNASSAAGSVYTWNGPSGFTFTGSSPVISPSALGVNNGTYTVVATLGACPSLPGYVTVQIFANPPAPKTYDTAFCQFSSSIPLRADSLFDSVTNGYDFLTWYTSPSGTGTVSEPYYPSTANPGTFTWYAMQTTPHGCISPRAAENIHVLDTPVFHIWQSSTFACQDSSVTLHYEGIAYPALTYEWTIPAQGASIIGGAWDSSFVTIRFDSLYHDTVSLYVWDHNWNISCHSNEQVNIKVVKMPTAHGFINPIVCAGDTVKIELTDRSDNSYRFEWNYQFGGGDYMVWSSSSTAGPFGACWNIPGVKDVTVIPYTVEGCRGIKQHDTVLVRTLPDGGFSHDHGDQVCAEDSVLFTAFMDSANCKYHWSPDHFFDHNGHSSCWGRVEVSGWVNLSVTDEFNCRNTSSLWIDIDPQCCIVGMPSAFSPNGDGHNDFFRPVYNGYHRFHIFRVMNRWGQTVFESTNNRMEWDGNYAGVPQDMGVYFYYLKYDCNGKTIEKRGDVTLIR